jgi:hypothetical protein
VARARGDLTRTEDAYRRSLDISELLAAVDAGNARAQRDLSVSDLRLGNVAADRGDLTRARELFERSLSAGGNE